MELLSPVLLFSSVDIVSDISSSSWLTVDIVDEISAGGEGDACVVGVANSISNFLFFMLWFSTIIVVADDHKIVVELFDKIVVADDHDAPESEDPPDGVLTITLLTELSSFQFWLS